MSCCAPSCCSTDSQETVRAQQALATGCCAPSSRQSDGERSGRALSANASDLPIAIIGAGPVGLAAAAHLFARGLDPVIVEAGPTVGIAPRAWGHVRMFSPWRYNIDAASRGLLEGQRWRAPDADSFPTGTELATDYLEPLARTPAIAARLRLNARVVAVTRAGLGKVRTSGREAVPFEIRLAQDGTETRIFARAHAQ